MSSDVIIVGGGVIGCTAAYALASAGFTVTVIEREQMGGQVAVVNTGMLGPYTEIKHPPAFAAFAERSFAQWPSLAESLYEETGLDLELVRSGLLQVALTDEEGARLQQAAAHFPAAAGAHWLDAAPARELEPALAPTVRGALRLPTEAHVNNQRLMRALLLAGGRRGVRYVTGAPVHAVELDGAAATVLVGAERLSAARVVLAAGSWTGALAATLGLHLPTVPVRGQLVNVRGEHRPVEHILYTENGYCLAKRDGTLVLGGTMERVGYRSTPTAGGVRDILARTSELLPGLADLTFAGAVAGLRPHLPDDAPAIGALPGAEQVVVATGHFRNGVLLAPATAASVVALVEGRSAPPGLALFDPARFARASEAGRSTSVYPETV